MTKSRLVPGVLPMNAVTGHFITANICAIALLMMAAFARSIKRNYMCALALIVMFFLLSVQRDRDCFL